MNVTLISSWAWTIRVESLLRRIRLHIRPKHFQGELAVFLFIFILCIATTCPHALEAQPRGSRARAIRLQGRVIDGSTGKPVEAAHIRLLPSGKGAWHTDAQGQFRFWIPDTMGERIEVGREDYRSVSVDTRPRFVRDIRLEPLPSSVWPSTRSNKLMPASQSVAPAIVTAESVEKTSGRGDAWSPWYRLGVGKAPGGYTVEKAEFWLSGDRACGAWAECRELVQSDSEVSWEFRLQGHSETGAPSRSFSTGHIRVIYRPQ